MCFITAVSSSNFNGSRENNCFNLLPTLAHSPSPRAVRVLVATMIKEINPHYACRLLFSLLAEHHCRRSCRMSKANILLYVCVRMKVTAAVEVCSGRNFRIPSDPVRGRIVYSDMLATPHPDFFLFQP
jgi:hypothetical protein